MDDLLSIYLTQITGCPMIFIFIFINFGNVRVRLFSLSVCTRVETAHLGGCPTPSFFSNLCNIYRMEKKIINKHSLIACTRFICDMHAKKNC